MRHKPQRAESYTHPLTLFRKRDSLFVNGGGDIEGTMAPVEDDIEFIEAVEDTAKNLGVTQDDIITAMGIETAGTFDPSIKNPKSTATGLIQFLPSTAASLGRRARSTPGFH